MYAGTTVNWNELLASSTITTQNDSLPLFLCVFSSDKGTEKITDMVYDDFVAMYGTNPDFEKYGQPLLQAHRIAQAGGRILGKRLVADDAILGNLIIAARVTASSVQKKDEDGHLLYLDDKGNLTTTVTETPAMQDVASIKYETYSMENGKTFNEVVQYAKTLRANDVYPLFIVCDNGRGVSVKNVRIQPDYASSRRLSYMYYRICSYEGTDLVEYQRFVLKPGINIDRNGAIRNLTVTKDTLTQLDAQYYIESGNALFEKLHEITGYELDDLYGFDLLFAQTLDRKPLPLISIDPTGVDINYIYGLPLQNGSNGNFGTAPFAGAAATEAWSKKAVDFFSGVPNEFYDADEIYDLDQHKIDFCVDANYPYSATDDTINVKSAIAKLADFREDFYYFRDLGLNINSIEAVSLMVSSRKWEQSPFVGDYESVYDIIDPYSAKQISVTMLYGLAPLLVGHFSSNMAAPIAGEFNGFVITEAVPGTLNIIPRVTPNVDQKQVLDDLRVNYVNYSSEGNLAIQSAYTSQDHEGPLSYVNNVLITQSVVKAIRRYCPKIRFMLMDKGAMDFSLYRSMIEDNVISNYRNYFKSISLVYTADDEMVAAKVFNASLYCYYRDFPQAEIFDVFAVEGSPSTNPV